MAKPKTITIDQALDDLYALKRDIFPYLHRDYNVALKMAMEALQKEKRSGPEGEGG